MQLNFNYSSQSGTGAPGLRRRCVALVTWSVWIAACLIVLAVIAADCSWHFEHVFERLVVLNKL